MIIFAFAEGATWYNYPGLELWKFFNLALFTAVGIYILRRPISAALATRREAIKHELVHAQETKARAVEKLAEADSLLSRLDSEVRTVHDQSRHEAEAERQRVAAATAREVEKLKQQAEREMETADKLARKALRQFFAQKSVQVARDKVRTQMRPEDDRHLIEQSIDELRRARV
ncbi:MAG: ATP synthase F0 subunit B [Acidobacteria bacterium]|nr:ATP synthase F0 subunit B [Acidobacteriota bacterium]MCA1627726.1 ATP synthase F0 subunit B [Acidobacteriota bacterium]